MLISQLCIIFQSLHKIYSIIEPCSLEVMVTSLFGEIKTSVLAKCLGDDRLLLFKNRGKNVQFVTNISDIVKHCDFFDDINLVRGCSIVVPL